MGSLDLKSRENEKYYNKKGFAFIGVNIYYLLVYTFKGNYQNVFAIHTGTSNWLLWSSIFQKRPQLPKEVPHYDKNYIPCL